MFKALVRALGIVAVCTTATSAPTGAATDTLPQAPAYLGMTFTVGRTTPTGVGKWLTVREVTPGAPADRAGIVRGDLIVAIAGKTIAVTSDLDQIIEIARLPIGKPVKLDIVRKGEKRTVMLVPAPMSAVMRQRWKAMIDGVRNQPPATVHRLRDSG